jgi:hypothetical protein
MEFKFHKCIFYVLKLKYQLTAFKGKIGIDGWFILKLTNTYPTTLNTLPIYNIDLAISQMFKTGWCENFLRR